MEFYAYLMYMYTFRWTFASLTSSDVCNNLPRSIFYDNFAAVNLCDTNNVNSPLKSKTSCSIDQETLTVLIAFIERSHRFKKQASNL